VVRNNKIAILSLNIKSLNELKSIFHLKDKQQYHIYFFSTITDYLKFISSSKVALSLIDPDLKNISLEQLKKRIVESSKMLNHKIILFSDRCLGDKMSSFFEIGVTDIFRPPLNRDEILYKLNKYLSETSLAKQFERTKRQLEKVTKINDIQQNKLKFVNNELHQYKNYLEEAVEEQLQEIKELNREIEHTQREIIFTMGAIGESRSRETGNHVKRVAEYSYLLATQYGLSEREAEILKLASPMHDIGKVAIPDHILKKPGRLTKEEFLHMQKHAELGYDILKHSDKELIKVAATVAYEHHEKWNGSGYPRKLKGEDIHIYGRITAVADVFDALGSDRVYKKAWSDDRIFQLFKEERGQHFEPQLVDIFFDNLNKFLDIREQFKDEF